MKAGILSSLAVVAPLIILLMFITKEPQKEISSYSDIVYSQQNSELEKSIERGRLIYDEFCIQCHGADGKGMQGVFPPLDGANWLVEKRTESIHAVKFGQSGEIIVNGITYNNVMPPMGLTDNEVADVMNYVMNSWSNSQENIVTVEEVKAIAP